MSFGPFKSMSDYRQMERAGRWVPEYARTKKHDDVKCAVKSLDEYTRDELKDYDDDSKHRV